MNERFASWMCSRQICSNCVMLSCQYGPKSLRNVSSTLLELYHEQLKQFWRQNEVQPGASKVYLIKWPVSVCVCVCVYILYIYIDTHTVINKIKWIYGILFRCQISPVNCPWRAGSLVSGLDVQYLMNDSVVMQGLSVKMTEVQTTWYIQVLMFIM